MGFPADLQDCALEHYPCILVANDGRPLCSESSDLQHTVGRWRAAVAVRQSGASNQNTNVIVLDHEMVGRIQPRLVNDTIWLQGKANGQCMPSWHWERSARVGCAIAVWESWEGEWDVRLGRGTRTWFTGAGTYTVL